jgi:hypothetical protein
MAAPALGNTQVLALLVGVVCAGLGIVVGALLGYLATGLAIGGVLGAVVAPLLHRQPDDLGPP